MASDPVKPEPEGQANEDTNATQWNLVMAAGRGSGQESRDALALLCENYWYPVYSFIRRKGNDAESAKDLTQAFFTRLVAKGDLARADAERGRFRNFLLTCVKNFLLDERDRMMAAKRGGGQVIISFQAGDAEGRYRLEPTDARDPEKIFEREWAITLLTRVLKRLRGEYESTGKGELFESLRPLLLYSADSPNQVELAKQLGASSGSIRVAVHRMRRRFGELLRREISKTVASDEDVGDEIKGLFRALEG